MFVGWKRPQRLAARTNEGTGKGNRNGCHENPSIVAIWTGWRMSAGFVRAGKVRGARDPERFVFVLASSGPTAMEPGDQGFNTYPENTTRDLRVRFLQVMSVRGFDKPRGHFECWCRETEAYDVWQKDQIWCFSFSHWQQIVSRSVRYPLQDQRWSVLSHVSP